MHLKLIITNTTKKKNNLSKRRTKENIMNLNDLDTQITIWRPFEIFNKRGQLESGDVNSFAFILS